MVLTLEITGLQAARLGESSRKVFRASGGTIGRLATNDWSLPDPYVSNRHALVRYREGVFYIEDTSTNGICINAPENRLARGTPHQLHAGDWIFIEPYEIKVSIAADVHPAVLSGASSPFADLFGPADGAGYDASPRGNADLAAPPLRAGGAAAPFGGRFDAEQPVNPGDQVDPLALLGFAPRSDPPDVPKAADLAGGSLLSDPYRPPPIPGPAAAAVPDAGPIPDDWFKADRTSNAVWPAPTPAADPGARSSPSPAARAADAVPPSPAPGPVPGAAARAPGGSLDLAELLAGAGLEGVPVTPELSRNFGRILRVVVGGVMDTLQARQKIKNEFRLGMTTFKPADNNPLKFSANVDDALHNLLVKRNPAYLGAVEAFEDAFDDVRNHQIAMLQAVRVAFDAMLAEFDPDRLQKDFDRRGKGALIAGPAKLRYWDQYREKIHDMVTDADATFRELFGDEFANAYEQQLQRLRAQRRQP